MRNGRSNQILSFLQGHRQEMVAFLAQLVRAESPSSQPEAQVVVQTTLWEALRALDFEVEIVPGQKTGGHLLARLENGRSSGPQQLLLGHCDTVWPMGTLREMPMEIDDQIMKGPGVYDMKGGLTQIIFALRTMRELGLETAVSPVVFINSDEEVGSFESMPHIIRLAQEANRAFVLEPSLGPDGKIKTRRKGVGRFKVQVQGRAAHAGLDPEKGISAILELSYVIQKLHALNDPRRGISVNVGLVEGGLRSNVIAPHGTAVVDVRVPTQQDAQQIEAQILQMQPETPGAVLNISGRMGRAPLEKTAANQVLWQVAQSSAQALGLHLQEAMAGGGSDGNTTSLYTATLDGLGSVGDGAHAQHEFIYLDSLVERCALLTLLLLAPPLPAPTD